MGQNHYVTVRLRNAVERYFHDHPNPDQTTNPRGRENYRSMICGRNAGSWGIKSGLGRGGRGCLA